MKLQRVTVTGIDANTNIERLTWLGKTFPFLECAFLASKSRAGQDNRYPTMMHINAWTHMLAQRNIPTAIHICGHYSRNPQTFFEKTHAIFERLQWNINPSNLKNEGLEEMIENQRGHGTVIVQIQDETSKTLLKTLQNSGVRAQPQPLFDASGGRGIPFETVQKPLDSPKTGRWTGYAGGITPKSVSSVLERLEAELPKEQPIWIDMETGVRTNDWLDLDKVQEVLCRCFTFLQEQKQ